MRSCGGSVIKRSASITIQWIAPLVVPSGVTIGQLVDAMPRTSTRNVGSGARRSRTSRAISSITGNGAPREGS